MWSGWAVYMADPVRNAGLGLACLYMTVLGFDSITSGTHFDWAAQTDSLE